MAVRVLFVPEGILARRSGFLLSGAPSSSVPVVLPLPTGEKCRVPVEIAGTTFYGGVGVTVPSVLCPRARVRTVGVAGNRIRGSFMGSSEPPGWLLRSTYVGSGSVVSRPFRWVPECSTYRTRTPGPCWTRGTSVKGKRSIWAHSSYPRRKRERGRRVPFHWFRDDLKREETETGPIRTGHAESED